MVEPFLGEIRMMSFNFAPKGWAQCNGQLLPINQNQALFSLMGTTFGGNGQTNFALPNFQGRTGIHVGNGISWGESAGQESHTITPLEMPMHNHLVNFSKDTTSRSGQPRSNFPADASPNNVYNPGSTANSPMAPSAVTTVGGSQPHNNMQPYLVINFCVALQGIFPSRN